ncbi:distal tail protein Dit [Mesobacillus stamsii]|uniref:Phage tail component-like protein n=1 Tax=Mesobacillus stamsii TaxID=225347 RepID=A0ABU0FWF0_9BACI|nr:distal tail protein Dit [Mesobacillus stamsii]MDQ0414239.1 putative phage tail component-like protein [Mesobacillus stamsii]
MMIFNGVDTKDLIDITKITGRGPATQEIIRKSVPGMDGSLYVKKNRPERPINVEFDLVGLSLEDMRQKVDDLNVILNTDGPVPIVFNDEPNKTYYGSLNGQPSWDEFLFIGSGAINIICLDPYKYGFEENITLGNYPILNGGTAETNPIITATFTATASEYKIDHSNGKFVRVIYNFVVGDVLTIDLTKRKVTINNNLQMTAYDWHSVPFSLISGENTLTVTPENIATTEIKFAPRWL